VIAAGLFLVLQQTRHGSTVGGEHLSFSEHANMQQPHLVVQTSNLISSVEK